MIEEDQDTCGDADGVGDFQHGKPAGLIPGCQLINLSEELRHVYIIIKCHDGKGRAEENRRSRKCRFDQMPDTRRRFCSS